VAIPPKDQPVYDPEDPERPWEVTFDKSPEGHAAQQSFISDWYDDPDAPGRTESEKDPYISQFIERRAELDAIAAQNADAEADEVAAAASDEEATIVGVGEVEFEEQCFLLTFLKDFVAYKKERSHITVENAKSKDLPYLNGVNSSLLVDGDPFGLINKLTQYESAERFYELTPAQISSLQPMISLYKVTDLQDGTEYEQEINFDSHLTPEYAEDVLKDRYRRGFGAGIKDFTFSYEADNPFGLKKSIKAKLTIFANDFDELLRERSPDSAAPYRYIELALKTGSKLMADSVNKINPHAADEVYDNLSKLMFRLKAVVGWQLPNGASPVPLDSIYNSYISLNLTPTTHEFNIDEMGRVSFVIHYLAYVEDFFDQPSFNIFTDPAVERNMLRRKLKFKVFNKECEPDQLNKLKKQSRNTIQQDKIRSLQSLMNGLLNAWRLYNLSLPYKSIADYLVQGPDFDITNYVGQALPGDSTTATILADYSPELVEGLTTGPSEEAIAADVEPPKPEGEISVAPVTSYGADMGGNPTMGKPSEEALAAWRIEHAEWKARQDARTAATAAAPSTSATTVGILDHEIVNYFYVNDLVDSILRGIDKSFENRLLLTTEGSMSIDGIDKDRVNEQLVAERDKVTKFYERFKKFRLVLGPMEIVNPQNTTTTEFVNFGDFPISTRYFTQWLTQKLLKKEESIYSLPSFLNDFFNQFMRDFMNSNKCFRGEVKQKVRLNQTALTGYTRGKSTVQGDPIDEITAAILMQDQQTALPRRLNISNLPSKNVPLPVINIAGSRGDPGGNPAYSADPSVPSPWTQFDYLIYFAARTQPTERMVGCRYPCPDPDATRPLPGPVMLDDVGDHARGIFHYGIGEPRGIVKTITFTKTDAPGLKEVRFEQQGYDGLQQLRETYDVNIKTFLNVSAFPGNYIFIEPQSFAPSAKQNLDIDLTQLGVGGYHMIIRSEHSLGPGLAESSITAKWVAEIDHKQEDTATVGTVGSPVVAQPRKCWVNNNREGAAKNPGGQ